MIRRRRFDFTPRPFGVRVVCVVLPYVVGENSTIMFQLYHYTRTQVHNLMRNLLPRLLPTILDGMRFADDDEMLENFEDTDEKIDRPEDIEPHLFGKQGKGGLHDDDDDGNSTWTDDQVEGKWTIRKASGLALDNIASVYGNQLLGLVLPELEKRLNHSDWRTRESAILAIGAVSEGGMNQFVRIIVRENMFEFVISLSNRYPNSFRSS